MKEVGTGGSMLGSPVAATMPLSQTTYINTITKVERKETSFDVSYRIENVETRLVLII